MKDLSRAPEFGAPAHAAHRAVRSFVRRRGRLTDGQKRALEALWPRFGVEWGAAPLDLHGLFGNRRPVILEIGFGDGEATWRMALAHPEQNFLGIEVHPPGIGRLLLAIEREGLTNVRIASGDAVEWLAHRILPASLDGVRIYFPDPWPKKRHHKRRLIQSEFVDLLASRMAIGAVLHLATDWAPYAAHMLLVLNVSPHLDNLSPAGGTSERPAWRPATKYESRGERLGHGVSDLVYVRNSAPCAT
jgi:tRNA (guanine-N7-)-methyltransferase